MASRILFSVLAATAMGNAAVLRLSDNPNYVEIDGRAAPMVGASVISYYNWANTVTGDYSDWLTDLQAAGLNVIRIGHKTRWSTSETASQSIWPYQRSATPGNADGLNKLDLDAWDTTYWNRLKSLIAEADEKGIMVELIVQFEVYDTTRWSTHAYNSTNNVNGVGSGMTWDDLTAGRNSGANARTLALIDKTATELNSYDNWYWEICNEPWAARNTAGVDNAEAQETIDWHTTMIDRIVTAESALPQQHLIAVNYMSDYTLDRIQADVSIVNTHYPDLTDAVGMAELLASYYTETRVYAFDESEYLGGSGPPAEYQPEDGRVEAWEALVGGGGSYDGLIAGDGFGVAWNSADAATYRGYLGLAKNFMEKFDLRDVHRDTTSVTSGGSSGNRRVQAISGGGQWGVYIFNATVDSTFGLHYNVTTGSYTAGVTLTLPDAGWYQYQWINPSTGAVISEGNFHHAGGSRSFATAPSFTVDIALFVKKPDTGLRRPPK